MSKRLLDYDYLTGLKTYHDYDATTRERTISYEHDDVGPVVKWAQDLANAGLHEKQRKKDVWHAACVPEGIILKWHTEGINLYDPTHWDRVRKKLNDPEYAYLRTWKGRI
ncbi:MAG TPA: hypothetical protein VMW24_21425 [Sedimentisphaerales bacterium]|nr:hypothetical protein [Sedimentisphaerales bacterium]